MRLIPICRRLISFGMRILPLGQSVSSFGVGSVSVCQGMPSLPMRNIGRRSLVSFCMCVSDVVSGRRRFHYPRIRTLCMRAVSDGRRLGSFRMRIVSKRRCLVSLRVCSQSYGPVGSCSAASNRILALCVGSVRLRPCGKSFRVGAVPVRNRSGRDRVRNPQTSLGMASVPICKCSTPFGMSSDSVAYRRRKTLRMCGICVTYAISPTDPVRLAKIISAFGVGTSLGGQGPVAFGVCKHCGGRGLKAFGMCIVGECQGSEALGMGVYRKGGRLVSLRVGIVSLGNG